MVLPLILGIVGSVAGGALGGSLGAAIGYTLGQLVGTMISPTKGPDVIGPRLEDLTLQTSSAVADLPRSYGTIAHRGNMIWAQGNALREVVSTSTKKKKVLGFTVAKQSTTTYTYFLTCAVAFCKVPEGATLTVLRIWIGDKLAYNVSSDDAGTLLASSDFGAQITIYPGTDDQAVDPTIAADVGAENASAYPGIFYIVLRDLNLSDFFNSVARAEMKVEYSVDTATAGGVEFLSQTAARVDAEWWQLYNANFLDADGLHVWRMGPADDAGHVAVPETGDGSVTNASLAADQTNDKYHYVAFPGLTIGALKQKVTGALPLIPEGSSVYELTNMRMPAKGRANTSAQLFTYAFYMPGGGGGGGGSGPDPRLLGSTAVLELYGFGWSGTNGEYEALGGTTIGADRWRFSDFYTAYIAASTVCKGPGTLFSQPGFDTYSFNHDNYIVSSDGSVLWGDAVNVPDSPFIPRYGIILDNPENVPAIPDPLEPAMFVSGPWQIWLSAIVVAPGYEQEYRVPLNGINSAPVGLSFFAIEDDLAVVGVKVDNQNRIYRLAGNSFDTSTSYVGAGSAEIVRMGFVAGSLYVLYLDGTYVLNEYDADLLQTDSLDEADILAAFGVAASTLVDSLSFDFTRFLYVKSGALYERPTLYGTEVNLGTITGTLIDGGDALSFFGMTRRGNILAVPTFGGSLPETGAQFFTVGLVGTPGTVPLADILVAECAVAGIPSTDVDVSLIDDEVRGYRIASRGSIRNVIQQLQACFPFDAIQSGYKLKFVPRGQSSVATVSFEDLGPDVQWRIDREMTTQLPRRVVLRYLDRDTEYEVNEQYSERPIDSLTEVVLEIPIVLTPDEAAEKADVLHSLYLIERTSYGPFMLPPTLRQVEPSDVVTVVTGDGTSYQVRLVDVSYGADGALQCDAKQNAVPIYTSTARGATVPPAVVTIPVAGAAFTMVLDTPVNIIEDDPGVTAVMGSPFENWTGGVLWRLVDNAWTSVQGFTGQCTFGTAVDALPERSGALVNDGDTLTIELTVGSIATVTEAEFYNEALLAAYGVPGRWEMIAARYVTDNMDGTLTLGTFLRGLRGTEWAAGLHEAGDFIVFLNDPETEFVSVAETDIDALLTFRGVSNGADFDDEFDQAITYGGENLRPLSVVSKAIELGDDDALLLTWTRRDRLGARWEDLGDIPMSEATEQYVVEIYNGDGSALLRTETVATTEFEYSSADQVADFGDLVKDVQEFLIFAVYQVSALVGNGRGEADTVPLPPDLIDPTSYLITYTPTYVLSRNSPYVGSVNDGVKVATVSGEWSGYNGTQSATAITITLAAPKTITFLRVWYSATGIAGVVHPATLSATLNGNTYTLSDFSGETEESPTGQFGPIMWVDVPIANEVASSFSFGFTKGVGSWTMISEIEVYGFG